MGDPCDSFVFIHAEQSGKLAPEHRKLIRSRSKPSTYKRRVVKGSGVRWIAYGNTPCHGENLSTTPTPDPPGLPQSVAPYEARNAVSLKERQQILKTNDAKPISRAGKALALSPRYLPLARYAGDLDPHSINILHSSSSPLPSHRMPPRMCSILTCSHTYSLPRLAEGIFRPEPWSNYQDTFAAMARMAVHRCGISPFYTCGLVRNPRRAYETGAI
jgi:hypothetical protein